MLTACNGADVLLYRVEGSTSSGGAGERDAAVASGARVGQGEGGRTEATGGAGKGGAPAVGGSTGGQPGTPHPSQATGGARTVSNLDAGSDADVPAEKGPGTCATSADCAAGWACSKLDCAAATGVCEPRPILCDLTPVPVCGCDGVTYWNDCVRQQNGSEASSVGQCALGARVCNTPVDCGVAEASCAHVIPNPSPCGMAGPGTCWVIPLDCSAVPPSLEWVPCQDMPFGNMSPGMTFTCVDTCTAIRSGEPYVAVPSSMFCQ